MLPMISRSLYTMSRTGRRNGNFLGWTAQALAKIRPAAFTKRLHQRAGARI